MNTEVIGKIYHIIDKTTERVIKVGSTIRKIEQRFAQRDYKTRYTNHRIVEAKSIKSTDSDWYDPKDAYCPFLWHLVASEHIEMLRAGTYRVGPLSNLRSPLLQKYYGKFGLSECGSGGGKKGGLKNVLSGHLRSISSKGGKKGGSVSGYKNGMALLKSKRGIFAPGIAALGGKAGGPASGKMAVESGQLASLRTLEHQRYASSHANHNRWHLNRGIKKAGCKLCTEGN